jgi:preprotein translocase subunit SecG
VVFDTGLRLSPDGCAGRLGAFISMNAATFFRTTFFLLILFVVIYIGTENTQTIDFHFSLLLGKPARTSAALVYFVVFAVGVIGGTLLNAWAGKADGRGKAEAEGGRSKKK